MCTIATAKVQRNYNCYNVYFNECLPKTDNIMKNQNSQKNGTRFQVANLDDEMFLESLQLQADMEDIETEVFMESFQHEAEMEELENEAFLESLRLQAELEDIAADAMMYL